MPKLTHATTGVTVEVSDETAKHLGAEWQKESRSTRAKKSDS